METLTAPARPETAASTGSFADRLSAAFTARRRDDDPLAERRDAAMQAFTALGLPNRRTEAYKYTRIEKRLTGDLALADADTASDLTDVAPFRLPNLDADLLVVVNGTVRPDLSSLDGLPEGVVAGSVRETAQAEPGLVLPHLAQRADDGVFEAMNTAFDADGAFLLVPDGVTFDRPLQIAFVTDVNEPTLVQTRNLYRFGANSEALVIETHHSAEGTERAFTNAVTEMVAAENSRINVLKLQLEAESADRMDTVHAVQTGRSDFRVHTYTLGGGMTRNNVTVVPSAEGCESHLYGLYILGGDQHVDNHTLIDHAAAGCFSNELYRGIVDERSMGVFNGKVFVRRDSQQTNAYQSSQGVVLSDDARHYSKPELEIYADDVKCSHGSTTGELEPEHVFYLRSRGVDETTAKSLLLYAFASDITSELPDEAIREYLDELIEQRLRLSASR